MFLTCPSLVSSRFEYVDNYCHLLSSDINFCHLLSFLSSDVIWCQIMLSQVTSNSIKMFLVVFCLRISSLAMECRIMSFIVIWCHLMSIYTISWHQLKNWVTILILVVLEYFINILHTIFCHPMSLFVMSCHLILSYVMVYITNLSFFVTYLLTIAIPRSAHKKTGAELCQG